MDKMTGEDPSPLSRHLKQSVTENIFHCLAPCKECTGYYASELLQKRFICICRCHHKMTEKDFASTD